MICFVDPCIPSPCKSPYSKCTSSQGKAVCRCPRGCSDVINRVCGSDYKTYNSECEMKLRSCRFNKMVTVLSRGRCQGGLSIRVTRLWVDSNFPYQWVVLDISLTTYCACIVQLTHELAFSLNCFSRNLWRISKEITIIFW